MSGHSKWSNIKDRKGAQDKKRSVAFTKLAKGILTAIRAGGGNTNLETNIQLRTAIDKAKEVNMPKDNIDRLLSRFEERKASLVTLNLEGYGPFGVPFIVEIETDNKVRTINEIKSIFKGYGGSLGEANSVMFQFNRVGEVEFESIPEEKQLDLIDTGVQDIENNIAIVDAAVLTDFTKKSESLGLEVVRSESVLRAVTPVMLNNEDELEKIMELIEDLEGNDDVISVSAGFDYAQKI